jgi:hypothetical protein
MKKIIIPVFLVAVLAIGLASAPSVMARGSEVIDDVVLQLDKTAAGTKLSGPITLFYNDVDDPNTILCFETEMYTFLRLRKGFDLSIFSRGPEPTCYEDVEGQRDLVNEFLASEVVPTLFPEASDDVYFAVKSVDQYQENDDTDLGLLVTILDVVIAVQD